MNFDLSQFDEYREDNRREVKKANGGLPISLWDTYSAFANCYGGVIILGVAENKVSKKKKMVVGKLLVFRMRPNSKKTSGIPSTILRK
mgnify:CR=1 FL=1